MPENGSPHSNALESAINGVSSAAFHVLSGIVTLLHLVKKLPFLTKSEATDFLKPRNREAIGLILVGVFLISTTTRCLCGITSTDPLWELHTVIHTVNFWRIFSSAVPIVLVVIFFSQLTSFLCTASSASDFHQRRHRELIGTLFLLSAALFFILRFVADWSVYLIHHYYTFSDRNLLVEHSISSTHSPLHVAQNQVFREWLLQYVTIPIDIVAVWLTSTIALAVFVIPVAIFSCSAGTLASNAEDRHDWKSGGIALAIFTSFMVVATLVHVAYVESVVRNVISVEQSAIGISSYDEQVDLQGSVTIKSSADEALPLLDFSLPTLRIIWPNGVIELEVLPRDSFLHQEGDRGSRLPLDTFLRTGGGDLPPNSKLVLRFSRIASPEIIDSLMRSGYVQVQVGIPMTNDAMTRPGCMINTPRFYTSSARVDKVTRDQLFEVIDVATGDGEYSVLVPKTADQSKASENMEAPPAPPAESTPGGLWPIPKDGVPPSRPLDN